jgi:hypothetical protein
MSPLNMEFSSASIVYMIYRGFLWESIMDNSEFMQLINTLRDLDHHQRKRLEAHH